MPQRTGVRGQYDGPAELWSGDSKLADVEVSLRGYVDVMHVKTIGYEHDQDNTVSWGGVLTGLSQAEQMRLFSQRLELHLPDGKVGNAYLADNNGTLKCSGWPPFPIIYNGQEVDDESQLR